MSPWEFLERVEDLEPRSLEVSVVLILYHPGGVGRPNPEEVLLEELRAHYSGKVVTGRDLDVY